MEACIFSIKPKVITFHFFSQQKEVVSASCSFVLTGLLSDKQTEQSRTVLILNGSGEVCQSMDNKRHLKHSWNANSKCLVYVSF